MGVVKRGGPVPMFPREEGAWYLRGVADVVRSELLSRHGFAHGFSLRTGGVSVAPFDSLNLARTVGDDAAAVAENRARFAQAAGFELERLFEVSQVHGARVASVGDRDAADAVRALEADALVATAAGAAVAVRVADCVPVLLGDPQSGAVAAVHAGWRGCVAGVLAAAIDVLEREAGARAAELVAAIGPHIRADAFEVGEDVAAKLAAAAPGEREVVLRGRPKPHVDLSLVVRAQLVARGLDAGSIDDVGGCTFAEPQRFFSFRRDGRRSGRHLAAITCSSA